MAPFLIIITGLPCTGKTTLGRRLAQALGWPFVHKDGIKEMLFEHLGGSDRTWSKQLGRASSELLYYFAETQLIVGRSLVIESNFDPAFATPRLLALQEKYGFVPIQIQCQAEGDVLFRRFQKRSESGERHLGHGDHLNYAEFKTVLLNGAVHRLAIGGPVFEIDTTDFQKIDYSVLIGAIQAITDPNHVQPRK
ncbi:MAG: AAA family ATPase [Chloroflexi bacterium]|nr:AAA family ATPase [Chloroflexota bacterium]